ncbi:signal peptidase I [Thermococcus sp.]|uniref:signal peptidase I n=1 Tax=Thermococcus sp. TaxID=35749 RepID=UPI0025D7AA23|nr:signal peptidase I [Thermococcus sp.]
MKKLLEFTFAFIVVVFLLGSLAGFFLNRPVFLSYAYSDSMTPTINRGDLFLMNPLARNFEVGDIVVFHRRDGWTVHRIFAITENGLVTKGDNNVATDQQDGLYPPVKDSDVAGKVVVLFDKPLVLRGGGDLINSMRRVLSNPYAIVLLLIVGSTLTFSGGNRKQKRAKHYRVSVKIIYAVASTLIIAGFLFVTVASWGTLAFTYSSTLAGNQREGWYLPGSTFDRNLTLENNAFYPFYYFVGGGNERAHLTGPTFFRIGGGSSATLSVHVTVPQDTRIYREEFEVKSYPAILPASLVVFLYSLSPYLPLVVYSLLLTGLLLIFYLLAGISGGDVLRIKKRRGSFLSKLLGDG